MWSSSRAAFRSNLWPFGRRWELASLSHRRLSTSLLSSSIIRTMNSRVFNNVRFVAHWCDFQSQVAPWIFFVRLYKTKRIDLFKENFGKNPEKTCKTGKNCNIFTFQKNLSVKMQKTNLLGLKIVHLFPKIWLFWEKKNYAPFCALFGHDWCAFKFRIIEHSDEFET